MKKAIIVTTVIVLGFIGLILWGSAAQKTGAVKDTGEKSTLTATDTVYDFGSISMKDGLVTKDFTVTNSTNKDIFIPTLVTSCMCTKAYFVLPDGKTKGPFGMPSMGSVPPVNETIKSGESVIIRAVYDPNAHGPAGVGVIDRFLTLTDESGDSLKFEIKAVVTP